MAAVRWSLDAEADLRSITDSFSRRSTSYAATIGGRILAAVEVLGEFPRMGRVVPEYEREAIRELIVGVYRVVYRLENEGVGVIGIIHGSRDLELRFSNEPWLI